MSAIVTKLMRQKMAADAYERAHPELAQERIRYREASTRALSDMRAKYPVLTADNLSEADQYRINRTAELLKGDHL